jgi:hypothetical protein
MLTALDANPDRLDEHEKQFVARIREFGWFSTNVFQEGDSPGFCYTTGFWRNLKVPELITFSLKSGVAHQLFCNTFNEIKSGRELRPKQRLGGILEQLDIVLLPVDRPRYAEHLGWSRWFYGSDEFPCVQLVWPDRNNVFPWQSGFERKFEGDQPDLSSEGWHQIQLIE